MISTTCPFFPCMWPCLGRISFSSPDFKAFSPNQTHGYCSENVSTPSCKPFSDFETWKQAIAWNQSCAYHGARRPSGAGKHRALFCPAGDLPCGIRTIVHLVCMFPHRQNGTVTPLLPEMRSCLQSQQSLAVLTEHLLCTWYSSRRLANFILTRT